MFEGKQRKSLGFRKALALGLGIILILSAALSMTGCGGSGEAGGKKEKPLPFVYMKADGIYAIPVGSETPVCIAEGEFNAAEYSSYSIYGNTLFYAEPSAKGEDYDCDLYAVDLTQITEDTEVTASKITKNAQYSMEHQSCFSVREGSNEIAYLKGGTDEDMRSTLYFSKEEGGEWVETKVAENVVDYMFSGSVLAYRAAEDDGDSDWEWKLSQYVYDMDGGKGSMPLSGQSYLPEIIGIGDTVYYVDRPGGLMAYDSSEQLPLDESVGILCKANLGGKETTIADNIEGIIAIEDGVIYTQVPEELMGLTILDLTDGDDGGFFGSKAEQERTEILINRIFAGELVKDFYCYRDGKSTLLCKDVCSGTYPSFLDYDEKKDIVFRTAEGFGDGASLSYSEFLYALSDAAYEDGYDSVEHFLSNNTYSVKEILLEQMQTDVAVSLDLGKAVTVIKDISGDGYLYAYGTRLPGSNYAVITLDGKWEEGGSRTATYVGTIEDGKIVGKMKKLASKTVYIPQQVSGNNLYYSTDKVKEDSTTTTLYAYDGTKSTEFVDQDCDMSVVNVLDSDKVLYIKDMDHERYMGELVFRDKDEEKFVIPDVYTYLVKGDSMYLGIDYSTKRWDFDLYITDLTGKEPVMVDENVLWTMN